MSTYRRDQKDRRRARLRSSESIKTGFSLLLDTVWSRRTRKRDVGLGAQDLEAELSPSFGALAAGRGHHRSLDSSPHALRDYERNAFDDRSYDALMSPRNGSGTSLLRSQDSPREGGMWHQARSFKNRCRMDYEMEDAPHSTKEFGMKARVLRNASLRSPSRASRPSHLSDEELQPQQKRAVSDMSKIDLTPVGTSSEQGLKTPPRSLASGSMLRSESLVFMHKRRPSSRQGDNKLLSQPSITMRECDFTQVLQEVPRRYQGANFDLLYSTAENDRTFKTVFKKVKQKPATLITIKDLKGNVFGAYASKEWSPQLQFYGNSECFLFTILPDFQVFLPTKRNEFYQLCNNNSMALGGGVDCGFGLILDSALRKGYSSPCVTFDNVSLCGGKEFDIETLEIWGLACRADAMTSAQSSHYTTILR